MDKLPPLPKTIVKREANVTPRILAWVKENMGSCVVEIKATAGRSIARSALLPHQEAALKAAESSTGIIHKISDAGHVRTPFDAFYLKNTPAYVVAVFTTYGIAYVIPIRNWGGASLNMETFYIKKITWKAK